MQKTLEKLLKKQTNKFPNSVFQTESHYYIVMKSGLLAKARKSVDVSVLIDKQFPKDMEGMEHWTDLFNKVENIEPDRTSDIPYSELKEILPFSSSDDTRYILNAVLMDDQKMVATDGRRLVYRTIDGETADTNSPIVPNKMIKDILEFANKKKDVSFRFVRKDMGGWFIVRCEDVEFVGELVEGYYPNYKQVVPKNETMCGKWKFNGKAILEAYKNVSKIYGKRYEKYILWNNGECEIQIISYGHTEHSEKIEYSIIESDSDNFLLRLNLNYLADFLKIDMSDFSYESEQDPICLGKDGWKGVLMPMRLS